MKFSVIFTVDCPAERSIREYLPSRKLLRLMTQTEGNEQYDYSYLEGRWEKGKHRKLCAVFTRQQFNQFIDETLLTADSGETMGSMGALGTDCWIAPAISFNSDDQDCIRGAYVTPLPDIPAPKTARQEERCWLRIKWAILRMWGGYRCKGAQADDWYKTQPLPA